MSFLVRCLLKQQGARELKLTPVLHWPQAVAGGQWQELTAGTCGHSIQLFKEGRQEDPGTGKLALSHSSYERDGAKKRQMTLFPSVAIQKLTPR